MLPHRREIPAADGGRLQAPLPVCRDRSRHTLVFVQIHPNKTAATARRFLDSLQKATPIKITHILTDNGEAFTDRLFQSNARDPSGKYEFDRLCADLGIEHRLTRPRTPQTNGMVERFNGRISDTQAPSLRQP